MPIRAATRLRAAPAACTVLLPIPRPTDRSMRQVTLLQPGQFASPARPPPAGPPGPALPRPHRIGVCGPALPAFAGRQPFFPYPRVLGHELGVEVLSVPPGAGVKPGDRCAVEP